MNIRIRALLLVGALLLGALLWIEVIPKPQPTISSRVSIPSLSPAITAIRGWRSDDRAAISLAWKQRYGDDISPSEIEILNDDGNNILVSISLDQINFYSIYYKASDTLSPAILPTGTQIVSPQKGKFYFIEPYRVSYYCSGMDTIQELQNSNLGVSFDLYSDAETKSTAGHYYLNYDGSIELKTFSALVPTDDGGWTAATSSEPTGSKRFRLSC